MFCKQNGTAPKSLMLLIVGARTKPTFASQELFLLAWNPVKWFQQLVSEKQLSNARV